MKANILGFWLNTGSLITLSDLFSHLKTLGDNAKKFNGYERSIFVGETPKYFTGLFVTPKNHHQVCELVETGGRMKINVQQAQQGSSRIDFNFFVVHKETGRGLYQHYPNSCRCRIFLNFCAMEFEVIREARKESEIARAGENLTDKDRDKINKKYGRSLMSGILVRPESFPSLVMQFKTIAGFEYELKSIKAETDQKYRILQGNAKRLRHDISFDLKVETKERAKLIIEFIKAEDEIGDIAVRGIAADGLERTIALFDNPGSFGNYEFDTLAENVDFRPREFADSVYTKEMISVADAHDHVLATPVI